MSHFGSVMYITDLCQVLTGCGASQWQQFKTPDTPITSPSEHDISTTDEQAYGAITWEKKIKNSNPVWVGLSSIFPQGRWLLQGVFTQTSLSLMGEAAPQQSWSVCSTSDSCTDTVGLKHQRLSYCWRPGSCCSLTLADKWGHSVRNWCWRGFLKRFSTVCYNMPLPQSVERHGHNCYLLPQFVV